MIELKFNGISPEKKFLKIGIQGNHRVDKIVFILSITQDGIDLLEYKPKLKIANKTLTYADIVSALDIETNREENILKLTLTLTEDITLNESVDMQLVFKQYDSTTDDYYVWQTKCFNVTFDYMIPAERVLEQKYPQVLDNIEKRLEEVEESKDSIVERTSYLEFPNLGKAGFLYIDTTAHKAYHWDEEEMKYYRVGDDLDDIKILDANGGN